MPGKFVLGSPYDPQTSSPVPFKFVPLRLCQGVLHVRYVLEGAHGLSEKFVNRSAIFRLVYWRVTIPKYRTCVNLYIPK